MKPSDSYRAGMCPACLGTGWVRRVVPVEGDGPCSGCCGVGSLAAFLDHQTELARIETEHG